MVGIYKILSPTGKVYIGQSWDIQRRANAHKLEKRLRNKIATSICKHGWKAHAFEVVHELPLDVLQTTLDSYEQFYLDQYRSCGFDMLNLREGGNNGKASEETKQKQSDAKKGKPSHRKGSVHTEEAKKKIRDKRKLQNYAGRPPKGFIPWNKGVKGVCVSWNKGKTYSTKKQGESCLLLF